MSLLVIENDKKWNLNRKCFDVTVTVKGCGYFSSANYGFLAC